MARRSVQGLNGAVRRVNIAPGAPEVIAQDILGARQGGNPEKCQRVLKRSVTQGYLMRKNNKYYFIPSRSMKLPSLVVMRRKGRRKSRRARRGRSRRRTAGMYLEAVMARNPVRHRARHTRRRPPGSGAKKPVQPGTSASTASPHMKVERKASASK